jgi:hypothetical protein
MTDSVLVLLMGPVCSSLQHPAAVEGVVVSNLSKRSGRQANEAIEK